MPLSPCERSSDLNTLRRTILLAGATALVAPCGWARGAGVEILASDAGGVYAELISGLQRDLAGSSLALSVADRSSSTAVVRSLVVTLGTKALRDAAQRAIQSPAWAQVPVLAALLPQSAWRSGAAGLPRGSSAIWLDQPVDRYVELTRQALPQRRRLGVLLGPTSVGLEPMLDRATSARGLAAVKANVDAPATDLFPALQGVLQNCDMLLALPDPTLYNAESLQNILIATYRQRVPMLSYTAAHARAGATLALHTPVEEVSAQIVRALRQFAAQGSLPAPEGPQDFSVVINEQVARSLSLDLRSPAELQAAVRRAEGRPS